MSPIKYKITHKKVHPPEADALADSCAKAALSVLAHTDEFTKVASELETGWLGNQNNFFLDSFLPLIAKSREYAPSTLQGIGKGFRSFQVDVEEQVPVYPV